MLTQKSIVTSLLSLILIAVNSEIAMAAEKTSSSSSFAGWPLIVLLVLLVVFRKQLFAEATIEEPDTESQTEKPVAKAKVETKASTEKTAAAPKPAPKAKVETETKAKPVAKQASSDVIDITGDGKQCQGSTAKGTRCKRTTTLATTTLKVGAKTYKLTVCTQHNNDKLKPFSELLK